MDKHLVLTFARMNPPTRGHNFLIRQMQTQAKIHHPYSDIVVALSSSHDNKKNPLEPEYKLQICQRYWPEIKFDLFPSRSSFISVLKKYEKEYKYITVVCGSDRREEYERILRDYNKKDFYFISYEVISLVRDMDNFYSSTSARKAARKGDFYEFKIKVGNSLYMLNLSNKELRQLYNKVRLGLGINNLDHAKKSKKSEKTTS